MEDVSLEFENVKSTTKFTTFRGHLGRTLFPHKAPERGKGRIKIIFGMANNFFLKKICRIKKNALIKTYFALLKFDSFQR